MRVLVACEFSGIVRDAFIAKGHDAVSCDLLPTERPGPHIVGDVLSHLNDGWELMIAHPPCTYLTNAGVRHLHSTPSKRGVVAKIHGQARWDAMQEAAKFFKELLNAPVNKICVENPVPHGYAIREIGCTYSQIIQPFQHGHGETKKTCLWLRNLPLLKPSLEVTGRYPACHMTPPSKDRWKIRSRTYQGIAAAMANQWG